MAGLFLPRRTYYPFLHLLRLSTTLPDKRRLFPLLPVIRLKLSLWTGGMSDGAVWAGVVCCVDVIFTSQSQPSPAQPWTINNINHWPGPHHHLHHSWNISTLMAWPGLGYRPEVEIYILISIIYVRLQTEINLNMNNSKPLYQPG